MPTKSMDLFGEALKAYSKGDKEKFYFKNKSGEIFEHKLKRYFRTNIQLSKLEKKLISLSHGNILDVGCGTGNYIPLLCKQGKVLGIDISQNVLDVKKIKNCKVANIFTFPTKNKFDTITLLENNLGIGGTVDKTKKLLKKLSKLLKKEGQILAIISRRSENKKYIKVELKPIYKQKIGKKFNWINFNINFLYDLCKKEGLQLKILKTTKESYLISIQK